MTWWQDLNPLLYLSLLLGVLIAYLAIEALLHHLRLHRIPIRVHVNGTRGKSSVTRLIAAGLRAGNIRTCAKVTGTLARFIDPDANETPIHRIGHTNIIEQVAIVKQAARLHAQALVIECMALQPLLQSLCELKLVQSTHGVLTNVRPDHLEVMGPTETDVAQALAGTVPVHGRYFTTERTHLPVLQSAARDRRSTVIAVSTADIDAITDAEVAGFRYTEFKENIALALAVCVSLGVNRATALTGMQRCQPDAGALCTYILPQYNAVFASAFAANDPVSTETLWRSLCQTHADCPYTILLVNCRNDRPERSQQLGQAIAQWPSPQAIVMIGTGTELFQKAYCANSHERPAIPLVNGEGWTPAQLLTWAENQTPERKLLVGIGNIAGIGLECLAYVQNLCTDST